MKKEPDFTREIEQIKEDLQKIETDILVCEAKISEMKKHKETLMFFLETIS